MPFFVFLDFVKNADCRKGVLRPRSRIAPPLWECVRAVRKSSLRMSFLESGEIEQN